MYYVGVDLGKKKIAVSVHNSQKKELTYTKITRSRESVERYFKDLRTSLQPLRVACETGNQSFWFADIMKDLGIDCKVGNANAMLYVWKTKHKTDKLDARGISILNGIDFIPEVHIPQNSIRDIRELLRGRCYLARKCAGFYNKIHSILDRHGVGYKRKDLRNKLAATWVEGQDIADSAKLVIKRYLGLIGQMDHEAVSMEREVRKLVELMPEAKKEIELSSTTPGIGWFSASLLYFELDDIGRFKTFRDLASYTGLVPGRDQTGQTDIALGITHQGNKYVRWILVQDAWVAIRHSEYHRKLFAYHKRRQRKAQKAIIPVARSLLKAVYKIRKTGKSYSELFNNK